MSLPNVIIGGAPRSGTSTLFAWLTAHPAVCGASRKETFYLIDPDCPLREGGPTYAEGGLRGYESFFEHCPAGARVVLEATTHYLYQPTSRRLVAGLPSKPTMIFLLRNPAERVYSSFQYTKHNLGRIRRDLEFDEYLRLATTRPEELARHVRGSRSAFVLTHDVQYGRYVEYLRPWIEEFGRDRVKVYLLEQMRADPRAFIKRVCEDLRLEPAFFKTFDFPTRNATRRFLIPPLQYVAIGVAERLRPGWVRTIAQRAYRWMQDDLGPPPESSGDRHALRELQRYYRPYNETLSAELVVDIEHWRCDP